MRESADAIGAPRHRRRDPLRPRGLLAIDNVISHAAEVAVVTELIEAEPAVMSSLVPIGAGLRLVVRST